MRMVLRVGKTRSARLASCSAAALIVVLCFLTGKTAYGLDGDELTKLCNGEQVFQDLPGETSLQLCLFYVHGVLDHAEVHGSFKPMDRMFCLPRGIGTTQVREKYLEWTTGKDLSGQSSGKSLIAALVDLFPCDPPDQ